MCNDTPITKGLLSKAFLLTLMLLLMMTAKANVVIKHNDIAADPIRKVEVSDNIITVTYNFPEITEVVDCTGSVRHAIPGFGFCYEKGYPQVPMRVDTFRIPKGCTATVSASRSNIQQTQGEYTLAPGLEEDSYDSISGSNKDTQIAINELFPSEIAVIKNKYILRDENLVDIVVNPIQYDPVSKQVFICNQLTYTLNIVPNPEYNVNVYVDNYENKVAQIEVSSEDVVISDINQVGGVLDVDKLGFEGTIGYIIVTTSDYIEDAQAFAKWKKYLGYTPYIISKDKWSDCIEVKNEIVKCCNSHPSIQYLLLLGDHEDIPSLEVAFHINDKNYKHTSDQLYGVTQTNSYIPDIFVGRICVNNSIEAKNVLQKLMRHEMCPVINESFYARTAQCGYFETSYPYYEQEDRRFILTSEEIKNYLAQKGIFSHRLYYAEPFANPKYYSSYYGDGSEIPWDLQKNEYSWKCNPQAIVDRINKGVFLTMYRGHGSYDSWSNLNFGIQHFPLLNNGSVPTTMFSITCNTGIFSHIYEDNGEKGINVNGFAEELLKMPIGGATAVIAASDKSLSGPNDTLAEGLIDAIWPNPGLYPRFGDIQTSEVSRTIKPSYRLGQILSSALFRMKEQWGTFNEQYVEYQYNIFHLFGDPSMYLHTLNPQTIKNVQVSRQTNSVSVTTDEDQISIGFYDPITDSMRKYEDSSATYYTEHPQDVIVCLTGHNKLTYLDGKEIPIPTIEIPDNENIVLNWTHGQTLGISTIKSVLFNSNIAIYDMHGKMVYSGEIETQGNGYYTEIQFPYSSGVYILSIIQDGEVIYNKKIIKH